jgi:hypothetical protein
MKSSTILIDADQKTFVRRPNYHCRPFQRLSDDNQFFLEYPNTLRRLDKMEKLQSYAKINEALH